jgi:type II secretory pathway pseudopilin PulG
MSNGFFQSRGFVESGRALMNRAETTPRLPDGADRRESHLAPGEHTGGCVEMPARADCSTTIFGSPRNPRCVHRGLNGRIGDRAIIAKNRRDTGKRAYTLIEVLVVAVVIVLMLGMALPVFRAITGSRSEAGASNIIASMLGRARADAVGIQQPYGVAFMYNPTLQTTSLAEVYFPPTQIWGTGLGGGIVAVGNYVSATVGGVTSYYINAGNGPVQPDGTRNVPLLAAPTYPPQYNPIPGLYEVGGPALEIVPDSDLVPLPAGIAAQTVCNCNFSGFQRISDGYLSFGIILFDSKGRLHAYNYGVSRYSKLATAAQLNLNYPEVLTYPGVYSGNALGVPSQFGLVVFQRDAWLNQRGQISGQTGYSDALYCDPTPSSSSTPLTDYNSSTTSSPYTEENWLDQNATPLLIDRYTGTLIKAE